MSTADKIVKLAHAEVKYREGFKDGHWDNREKYAADVPGMAWVSTEGQPWCAVFNCWLDVQAGLKPAIDFPLTASCDTAAAWFKARGRLSQYPAIGAWVFFGSSSDYTHTGRVVGWDADWVYTVEGNTNTSGAREGNGVYAKKHLRRDAHVAAYGYPMFADGIKSADPHRKAEAPKTVKPKIAGGTAAGAAAAVVAASLVHPAAAAKPAPKPVAKASTIKATGGTCVVKVAAGKPKFSGSCVITITKGK